ncbi:uncharacterized protein K452DRAFT_292642 [Aplosporella prunicola CBS 121167]|uniref:Uncharacterized protein n=1 Tax=Aplosporella prunicola CBS 121167 TaxID=1176127 RepID=A0A6A6AY87_9PEZI|nr:uncharacterized protein K452DRAFT_292642 [Aplosporella prunicola CBS 121167]KAF2136143.1 hypothetical protein K452DRAFT_292642 [Aplosporella prunicola CBS 121167]
MAGRGLAVCAGANVCFSYWDGIETVEMDTGINDSLGLAVVCLPCHCYLLWFVIRTAWEYFMSG